MPKQKENKFFRIIKNILHFIGKVLYAIVKGIYDFAVLMNSLEKGWDDSQIEEEKGGLLNTKAGNIKLIMSLAAEVINVDGNVQHQELDYVEKRFVKDYNPKTAKIWISVLQQELAKKHDLKRLCAKAGYRFDRSTKIQLLHFLCGIVTRDGMLTESEFIMLKQIGMRIKLPFATLKSILALFDFITEAEFKERQNRKSEPRQSPKWRLERAYAILEITAEATDKEVKKAFKKLAVIHHPDKVIHMGESFRKAANQKFKELLEAYELIKADRGMV